MSLLRNKVIVWMSKIEKVIKAILSYAHNEIKEWQKVEEREKIDNAPC